MRFVFEDSENDLWVGTNGGGLTRFKPRRVRNFGREQGVPAGVSSVCSDGAGGLLVGTYGSGLFRWSDSNLTNISLKGISNAVTYLHSVLRDSTGRLWLGTFVHGLWMSEQQTARAIPPEQSSGNNVLALFEDSRGRIWISGGGAGISFFDGKQFHCVKEKPRVTGGFVTCFAEDRQGELYTLSYDGHIYSVTVPTVGQPRFSMAR